MKAKDFLENAIATLAERGSQYESGGEENSMRQIVELNRSITPGGLDMDELEGWYFMLALKLVRLRKSIVQEKASQDSIVDLLGYMAKMGECLFPPEEEPPLVYIAPRRRDDDDCAHTSATLKDVGGDVLGIVCDNCGHEFSGASDYISGEAA